MVLEEDKYRAELFKIGGFALMSPFGKFVIDILSHNFYSNVYWVGANFIVSILLFFLGGIILLRGYEAVEERKGIKWK